MSTAMNLGSASDSMSVDPITAPTTAINDPELWEIITDPESKEATLDGLSVKAAHERLKALGHETIQLAVLRFLYRKFKDGRIPAILEARSRLLTNERLAKWADDYKMNVNCVVADLGKREKLHASIFEAYVGAVVNEHGYDYVVAFLTPLIDNEAEDHLPTPSPMVAPPISAVPSMATYSTPTPLPPPPSNIPLMYGSPNGVAGHPPYSPISPAPVPVPAPNFIPPQQTNASRTTGALAALRQNATQLRKIVTFNESHQGPDHQRTWTCGVLIDGQEYGRGTANTKQMAKDQAAQQAMARLGWS